MPEAPAVEVDPVPRIYFVKATGTDASGGVLVARLLNVLPAYPGSTPCAVDDVASTALGQAVRIAVLANDVAPPGGSLDPTSLRFENVYSAEVVVDPVDGAVVYTPDPGFVGVDAFEYWVYDNWGVGERATVSVTVDAGCTITGAAGVVEIVGTAGDDVICVPDPSDRGAFHVIDARGGDDVILGSDGVDWIDGGPGSDTVYGRAGNDRLSGGPGVDVIYGGEGFDTIHSTDLVDVIHDDAESRFDGYEVVLEPEVVPERAPPVAVADVVYAALGETLVVDVVGNDHDPDGDLDAATLLIVEVPAGGAVEVRSSADLGEHVVYTAPGSEAVESFAYEVCDFQGFCSTATVTVTVGIGGCTVAGTPGDDTLWGTAGDDVICGLDGDDVIHGLGGDDVLIGGDGDDTLYGGNDTLIGDNDGDDVLFGGDGDDTLYGGDGDDTLWAETVLTPSKATAAPTRSLVAPVMTRSTAAARTTRSMAVPATTA